MVLTVSPIYAGILAILFITLSVRVIVYRRGNRISVGDGGDRGLVKRMRVHANCAEYAPLGLLLLAMAELSGAPAIALHLAGLTLVAGRLLHAYGFGTTPQVPTLRVAGMMLTFIMIGVTGLGLLAHALF